MSTNAQMDDEYDGNANADSGKLAALDCLFFGGADDLVDDSSNQQTGTVAVREADTSSNPFSRFAKFSVDCVGAAQGSEVTFSIDKEFNPSSFGHLSSCDAEEKRLIQVTVEDFEVEEAFAVQLMMKHIRNSFLKSASDNARKHAIEWIFVGTARENEVDFETCCYCLGVREHVLKTRIHYEFYRRWTVFSDFPFLTKPMPEDLANELLFQCGYEGLDLARHAWYFPGIDINEMLSRESGRYSLPMMHQTIESMTQRGFISMRVDNVYCTGRNPGCQDGVQAIERQTKRSRVIWSRLW